MSKVYYCQRMKSVLGAGARDRGGALPSFEGSARLLFFVHFGERKEDCAKRISCAGKMYVPRD